MARRRPAPSRPTLPRPAPEVATCPPPALDRGSLARSRVRLALLPPPGLEHATPGRSLLPGQGKLDVSVLPSTSAYPSWDALRRFRRSRRPVVVPAWPAALRLSAPSAAPALLPLDAEAPPVAPEPLHAPGADPPAASPPPPALPDRFSLPPPAGPAPEAGLPPPLAAALQALDQPALRHLSPGPLEAPPPDAEAERFSRPPSAPLADLEATWGLRADVPPGAAPSVPPEGLERGWEDPEPPGEMREDSAVAAPEPAEMSLVAPLGSPATFDLHAQVSGPLDAPASFETPPAAPPPPAPPPLPPAPNPRSARGASRPSWELPLGAWLLAGLWLALLGSAWTVALGMPRPLPRPPPPPPPVYVPLDTPRPLPAPETRFDPLPPLPPRIVLRGSGARPKIALTFDACSTPRFVGWDPRVVDVLERYEVPATFFLGGRLVDERPELIRLLAENPLFELQGHTYLHPHLTEIPVERLVSEMRTTDHALFQATGRRAVMFRPPFGEYSPEVVLAATQAGYLPIQFDVASGDPDPGFHVDKLLESLLTQVRPGSIVVLHTNGHGVHTPDALPMIIEALRDRGYELTTVGDVLADGNWIVDDGHKGPRPKNARPAPPPGTPPRPPVDGAAEVP